MGRAYKAWDPILSRTIAINILDRGLGADGMAAFFDRFRAAYEEYQRRHANDLASIAILDLFQIGGLTGVAVKYAEGKGAVVDAAED